MTNPQDSKINSLNYGMSMDPDPTFIKDGKYRRAINTVLNSHHGDVYTAQNEPANSLCLIIDKTIIGHVSLPNNKVIIFSTNNTDNEIGTYDPKTCEYTTLVTGPCLNFSTSNPIKGLSKENFDCSYTIYWVDGGRNPRRYLNLNKIPYEYTEKDDACKTKLFTSVLDCSELNLAKKISYPIIDVELESDGNLRNGVYQVALAYTIDKQRVTSFYSVTSPQSIFSHENFGRSLVVNIANLDRDFEEYELVVIWTQQGTTSVERIGYYSTADSKVTITNVGNTAVNQSNLTIEEILAITPYYETATDIASTAENLIFLNPTTRKELNYQQTALKIRSKWALYKVPLNYYRNGGNKVGYMRDEIYAFGIQWLYDTGDWSPVYHIPGRSAYSGETGLAGGPDVFENDSLYKCDTDEPIRVFETTNTARLLRTYSIDNNSICSEELVAEGEMAYWESSESYPDNTHLYGSKACKPITHHKFPDNSLAPLHGKCDEQFMYILGVKFDNIQVPNDPTIKGFRIVRGNRQGNKSVLGKGLLFNTGQYQENVYNAPQRDVMYPNYPLNDLRNDPFLSKTQTKYKVNKESDYQALDKFNRNKFTFHSPSFHFNNPGLGGELKIETEEVANVKGYFEPVYKHPKHKLVSNGAALLALLMATAEADISLRGPKKNRTERKFTGLDAGFINSVERLETTFFTPMNIGPALIMRPKLLLIPALAFGAIYYIAQNVDVFIKFIRDLSNWQQYAYQYNSHGKYCTSKPVEDGQKRRRINYYQYLLPGIQEVNGIRFNNYNRESSVYLELNSDLKDPSTQDTTRNTIRGFNLCNNVTSEVQSVGSSYYASVKLRVVNQYGQIDSVNYFATSGGYTPAAPGSKATTDLIFGGDSYVNLFSVMRKMSFFNNTLFDLPNGFEWNYKDYRNVAYPRYWADLTEYDGNDLARLKIPTSKHNLDCSYNLRNVFLVKNRYFYLYNSAVIEFFSESEYNIDNRDWDDTLAGRHYDHLTYTSLSELFRSDRMSYDNKYIFNIDYLKQLTENIILKQNRNYDPAVYDTCYTNFKNRVIYSLPQTRETVRDNWRVFLLANYYDFSKENGNLTTAKPLDRDRILFLFDNSSPYISLGVDTLRTEGGTDLIIGTGGLFAQRPQRLIHTDFAYGNCQSRFAFVQSQFGLFYPSQRQGRVFLFNDQMEEISKNDLHWWFKENLPSKLLKDFPAYPYTDNPISGVGLHSTFDNSNEIYYLCKKDWCVKDEFKGKLTYNAEKNKFYFNDAPFHLGDERFFDSASWTISYDPKLKAWVSFHDWIPDWIIQTENHFTTVKNNSLWKHNERCDLYCNFYGKDYPWEIEFIVNNGLQNKILHSIEWNLEAFKYNNLCYDPFHILNWNFDEAYVFNTEQNSGLLKLKLNENTRISEVNKYPIFGTNSVQVVYDKEEQKYRLNQFSDLTKDRGEFSKNEIPMWVTQCNGYRKVLNDRYINYKKSLYEQKKFRHLCHYVILRKSISGSVKGIFKFNNSKQVISNR